MKRCVSLLAALLLSPPTASIASTGTPAPQRSTATAPVEGVKPVSGERRVLALYWYPSDHPVTVTFDRQFQAELDRQSAGTVERYAEYFESARFPGEAQAHIMRDYLRFTERKSAEITLEQTRHELARVARVTTLAQFAASIAHESSQPLNAILLNARACLRWLRKDAPSIDQLRATLQDIADAATQANAVITRNRGMFSRRRAEKKPVNVNRIVDDVISLARTRLHKSRVLLETDLDPDVPGILGDRVELQQVLLNIFLNGIEAVETANPAVRQLTVHTRATRDGRVQIAVHDTGVGLRGVDPRSLFAPFYTTKPEGTGFGLSISRVIVEDHGGRLWAESNEDGGATFFVTIPVPQPGEHHPMPRLPGGQSIH
jgi:C4-dicarboxylate-specific signal transduction histidine kinase